MATKVFKYGIINISNENIELLQNHFYQANKFYNELISNKLNDNANYKSSKQEISSSIPEIDELQSKISSLKNQLVLENTQKELNSARKTLKKYKQTNHEKVQEFTEKVKNLELKLKQENTLLLLETAKSELIKIKEQFKSELSKEDSIIKDIKKSIVEKHGYTLEHYQNRNCIGLSSNSKNRKLINDEISETIKNSSEISDSRKLCELNKKSSIKSIEENYKLLSSLTRTRIKESAEQADKVVKKKRAEGKDAKLRYKRYDGSGKVSVQIMNNPNIKDLFEDKLNVCSIKLIDYNKDYLFENDNRWDIKINKRNLNANIKLILTFKRKGIPQQELNFIARIHRKPPTDSIIKYVEITSEKIGPNTKYYFLLTLESKTFDKIEKSDESVAGLDIGWGKDSDSLRFGAIGDLNNQEVLILPKKIKDRLEFADDIKSKRDLLFDNIIPITKELLKCIDTEFTISDKTPIRKLVRFIKEFSPIKAKDSIYLDWMKERKLKKLDLFCDKSEFDTWLNNKEISDNIQLHWYYLDLWLRKNHHLYQYEMRIRRKARLYRKDHYNKLAYKYGKNYNKLIIESFDLPHVIGEDTRVNKIANKNRVIVCISELKASFYNIFVNINIEKVNPKNTSSQCSYCEHLFKKDIGKELKEEEKWKKGKVEHVCGGCKRHIHRDKNAVRNIIKRSGGGVVSKVPGPLEVVESITVSPSLN